MVGHIPSAPTLIINLFLPFNVFTEWKRKGWVGGQAPEFHTLRQKMHFNDFICCEMGGGWGSRDVSSAHPKKTKKTKNNKKQKNKKNNKKQKTTKKQVKKNGSRGPRGRGPGALGQWARGFGPGAVGPLAPGQRSGLCFPK